MRKYKKIGIAIGLILILTVLVGFNFLSCDREEKRGNKNSYEIIFQEKAYRNGNWKVSYEYPFLEFQEKKSFMSKINEEIQELINESLLEIKSQDNVKNEMSYSNTDYIEIKNADNNFFSGVFVPTFFQV